MVRVTDLYPANLGSSPADTDKSHWWQQEGSAKMAAMRHSTYEPLNKGVNDDNFGRTISVFNEELKGTR